VVFDQLTILGPGLLGASLAMAAKDRGLTKRVVAWSRRSETRARCIDQPWCDAVESSPEAAVAGSGLVVLCTPVDTIAPLVAGIRPALDESATVTDVGSTKSVICRSCRSHLDGHPAQFIGSHPMAGSEKTGMSHARSDLFERAACLITPLDDAEDTAIARLIAFWEGLGMIVQSVSPERHDEIVAHVSHLPHFLASALCSYLSTRNGDWRNFAGGGLRDTTRIAAGDPALWQPIFGQNREELVRALDGFEAELHQLKAALLNDETLKLTAALERGKAYRDRMPPSPEKTR